MLKRALISRSRRRARPGRGPCQASSRSPARPSSTRPLRGHRPDRGVRDADHDPLHPLRRREPRARPGLQFVGADSDTIDCAKNGVTSVVLDLGDGDDVASINPSLKIPVIFDGADGRDGLFGGGGTDIFNGGPGDDNIISRDGRAEQVDCGRDTTPRSPTTATRALLRRGPGRRRRRRRAHPADCDDTNPGIHPGAVDVPDNGIDEDCSGVDAVDLDRDGDGSPRPQDCDDTVARSTPARGGHRQHVDENCDGRIEPYPPLIGSVAGTFWKPRRLANAQRADLTQRRFAARARRSSCAARAVACPFKVVRRTVGSRRTVSLHGFFRQPRAAGRHARSSCGSRSRGGSGACCAGRCAHRAGAPDVDFLCLPPGGRPSGC